MTAHPVRGALAALAAAAAVTGGLWLAACGATTRTPPTLLPDPAAAPPEVQAACQLTAQRCSHCHPIDRLVVARGIGMHRWALFVDEMRLKPSSGISLADAEIVLRCLRHTEEPPPPAAPPTPPAPEPAAEPDTNQGRS